MAGKQRFNAIHVMTPASSLSTILSVLGESPVTSGPAADPVFQFCGWCGARATHSVVTAGKIVSELALFGRTRCPLCFETIERVKGA